jgi:predicted Fe-Mo cluster-binding NifX family protein
MKKVAIPLQNGCLCLHFGHCKQFAIVEVNNNTIVSTNNISPPPHEDCSYPGWLAELGVTDVIASGIGQRAIALFEILNINITIGAQLKKPTELVFDWLTDSLITENNTCEHQL